MVTLEELKTILQDYAAKTVTYDRLKAKEHDEQDGWRYVLLSECSAAYHDESRWDNIEITLSEHEPESETELSCLQEAVPDRIRDLCSLFKGYKCSVLKCYHTNNAESVWERENEEIIIKLEPDDEKNSTMWLTVSRDEGRT